MVFPNLNWEGNDYSKISGAWVESNLEYKGRKDLKYTLSPELNINSDLWIKCINQEESESLTFDTEEVGTCLVPTIDTPLIPVSVRIVLEKFKADPDPLILPDDYVTITLENIDDPANPTVVAQWEGDDLMYPYLSCPPLSNISGCPPPSSMPCDCQSDPSCVFSCFDLDTTIYLSLPMGSYRLTNTAKKGSEDCDCFTGGCDGTTTALPGKMRSKVELNYQKISYVVKEKGGGIRIKRIITDDGDANNNNTIIKDYSYITDENECFSSGVLGTFPLFSFEHFAPDCMWVTAFSSSQVSLGSTNGSMVSYSRVTETVNGGGEGKTVYHFNTAWEEPDLINCSAPNAIIVYYFTDPVPASSSFFTQNLGPGGPSPEVRIFDVCNFAYAKRMDNSWKRGDLLLQEVTDNNDYLVQKVENEYTFSSTASNSSSYHLSSSYAEIEGLYIHFFPEPTGQLKGLIINYHHNSGFKYLSKSSTTVYDPQSLGQSGQTTTTEFFYESQHHLFPTRTVQENSDNTILENKTFYILDVPINAFNPTGPNPHPNIEAVYKMHYDQHWISAIASTETWLEKPGASIPDLVSAQFNTYKESSLGTEKFVQDKVFVREMDTPLAEPSHVITPGSETGHPIITGDHYTGYDVNNWNYSPRISFDAYTGVGNILQVKKENDQPISYLWNHSNSLPVAQTLNASKNEIAYTSFENINDLGNWSFSNSPVNTSSAKTGSHIYSGGGSITSAGATLGNKEYVVSFWVKASGTQSDTYTLNNVPYSLISDDKWIYVEHILSNPVSITLNPGNFAVDELRLYPADAQMVTYCYDEALRVHTVTDANGKPATTPMTVWAA